MTIEKRSAMLKEKKYLLSYLIVLLLLLTGCVGKIVKSEHATEKEGEPVEIEEVKESPYAYSDFMGYYLHFDSDVRSHSDMIVTIGNTYLTIGWQLSELELYEILDWTITNHVLTIDYYLHPYNEGEGEYGVLSVNISEEDGEKFIDFGTDMPFYEASYDEVLNYEYALQADLVEDINK